jgi:hypothetical protein
MPDETGELFPALAPPRGRTLAPPDLKPAQLRVLEAWAERTVPWISRGAFESYTTLESHVEEVLEWWDGAGRMKRNWVSTIRNRIRQIERRRLERIANRGSEDARLALRQPQEWARRYDRKLARVAAHQSAPTTESMIRPAGGRVIHLSAPRSG